MLQEKKNAWCNTTSGYYLGGEGERGGRTKLVEQNGGMLNFLQPLPKNDALEEISNMHATPPRR